MLQKSTLYKNEIRLILGANGNGSQKHPTNKGLDFKTLPYDLSCKLHTLGY